MVAWVGFGDGFFVDENIRGKPYFSIVQIWRKLCHSVKLLTPKTKPNTQKKRAKFWVLVLVFVFVGVGEERNKKKVSVCVCVCVCVCVESGNFYFWGGETVMGTEIETEKRLGARERGL